MRGIYSSPFRVYLSLLLLALVGIWMGMGLPISLFPNSSKPEVYIRLNYGGVGMDDFRSSYGGTIESRIRAMNVRGHRVEKLEANYSSSDVSYSAEFEWGAEAEEAMKETETLIRAASGGFPKEIRDSLSVGINSENAGFFAASFYSETRGLDEIYKEIEPIFSHRLAQIVDAKEAVIWNPNHKNVIVELDPERMASLQIFPRDIQAAIQQKTEGYSAGSIQIGYENLPIDVKKPNATLEDLSLLRIDRDGNRSLLLGDIAKIDYKVDGDRARSMKTSGSPSLILWAQPKPGGNVKKMSEDILALVEEMKPSLAKDIHYKVLVDPSEFIRGAIENVFHEVLIGSLLAVAILFLFIGSLKNVVTAAIEIPLSMVLAFILMKMTGMNLNLISLGGLALASGMNVDASVVVMENIFRHLEKKNAPTTFSGKLTLILEAVKEVRLAVIASTIASLVVFAPLAFTSDLTYAVLGDLAKTVIFSHGCSAFVALLLVPTVRLHLLSKSKNLSKDIGHSPIEGSLKKLESGYRRLLSSFVTSKRAKQILFLGVAASLVLLSVFALPKLPKEILGTPDTDWMMLGLSTQGNTLVRQMENQTEEVELRLLKKFSSDILYTFTQVNGSNRSWIMARLRDKKKMKEFWKALESEFKDGATLRFWTAPWNPAELPLPNPPDLQIAIEGGEVEARREIAKSLADAMMDAKVLPKVWTEPNSDRTKSVILRPFSHLESSVSPSDLADILRVATTGKTIHYMNIGRQSADILLKFPKNLMANADDLGSFPIGVGSKVIPLRALSDVKIEEQTNSIHSENGRELYKVIGRKEESAEKSTDVSYLKAAEKILNQWKLEHSLPAGISVRMEDAQIELNSAIKQLTLAVGLSIAMILFTLLFQLGSILNSLIVLVAIPLGFIGVITSLFLFQSTLSLNSVLGVILLNGIAVANSIILVDFTETLYKKGYSAKEAVLEAATKRLRPILITSLTTILGMLPIALGFGQGGRILQPLGIAVSGGLWVSMSLTLFIVPALHYALLARGENKMKTLNSTIGVKPLETMKLAMKVEESPHRSPGIFS